MPLYYGQMPSPGLYERIGESLGLKALSSDEDLARVVDKRLSPKAIDGLLRQGLTGAEAYDLIIPRRTLAHRSAKGERLSREESDRAVRVARTAAMAEIVFGEPARAWRWLRKPKERFDGRTPCEMLATEAGARLVEEMLVQLDHGMAA